ncbi:hypothetical protein BU15DRAFT_62854 [Melanogaster broomeanus]|nr:hypothetical protein BU15DRAFT_62854 [Melanogaster broomeanus]
MASDPLSTLGQIQLNDYISVITFSNEVEYVWLRYFGLLVATLQSFGTAIVVSLIWGNIIFLIVFDLMFILRVYAMYSRSKMVLGVLLLAYVPVTISLIVLSGIANNPNTHLSVTNVEVVNKWSTVTPPSSLEPDLSFTCML